MYFGRAQIGTKVVKVTNDWDEERKRRRVIEICGAIVVVLVVVAIIWSLVHYGL